MHLSTCQINELYRYRNPIKLKSARKPAIHCITNQPADPVSYFGTAQRKHNPDNAVELVKMLFNKFFKARTKEFRGKNYNDYYSLRQSHYLGHISKEAHQIRIDFFTKLISFVPQLGGDTFLSDGLLVWGREITWINRDKFKQAISRASPSDDDGGRDSAIAWRSHVACWAASMACRTEGDFFEFGCYEGYTALLIRSYIDDTYFKNDQSRKYHWFDLFSGGGPQKRVALNQEKSYEIATARASHFEDISIYKGDAKSTYLKDDYLSGKKVAFAHFDTNNFQVEKELVINAYQNSGPGTVFLFDDFSMRPFRKQNEFYTKFLNEKGIEVLDLPTGQGVALL